MSLFYRTLVATEFFASTHGISIQVDKKLYFYDINGAFLKEVDISQESGIFAHYWVDRVYGSTTIANIEIIPEANAPTAVLIKVDSNGEEILPDDERIRYVHNDGTNVYETYGVNGGTPYGSFGSDGYNGGVWRLYAGRIFKNSFDSVTTLCVPLPETEAPVILTQPPTEAPVTSTPTEEPVTDAPVTDTPVTDAPVIDDPVTDAPEIPETSAPEVEETTVAPGVTGVTTTTTTLAPGVTTTTTTLAPGVTTTTLAPGAPTAKPTVKPTTKPTVKPTTKVTTKVTTTKAVVKTTTSAPNKDVGPTSDPYITIIIKTSDATSSVANFFIVLVALLYQFLC